MESLLARMAMYSAFPRVQPVNTGTVRSALLGRDGEERLHGQALGRSPAQMIRDNPRTVILSPSEPEMAREIPEYCHLSKSNRRRIFLVRLRNAGVQFSH